MIPCEKVRSLPMFKGVDDAVIASLLRTTAARLKRYEKQKSVFAAQSEVRHVFVVVSGALKISEYGAKGEAHILRVSWRAQSILSCRTIGDRVMTYLRWMQAETGKKEVVLSLNRQELADLLGVHRTALSRTLAQLVASGQLACRKNVFRLLK